MNWGHAIVLVFVLFAAFIGYLVIKSFQQNIDLVAEDYYAKEIAYQKKLHKLAHAKKDDQYVLIEQTGDEIHLAFPAGGPKAKGKVHFYHASKKIFDRTFDILLNKDQVQKIQLSELVKGNYQVKVDWKIGDQEYFQQSRIYIQ